MLGGVTDGWRRSSARWVGMVGEGQALSGVFEGIYQVLYSEMFIP